MLTFLLLFACGNDDADTSSYKNTDNCADMGYEEIEAEGMPGWTAEAGCDIVCEDVDAGGLLYHDCYLTADDAVICQYDPPCG